MAKSPHVPLLTELDLDLDLSMNTAWPQRLGDDDSHPFARMPSEQTLKSLPEAALTGLVCDCAARGDIDGGAAQLALSRSRRPQGPSRMASFLSILISEPWIFRFHVRYVRYVFFSRSTTARCHSLVRVRTFLTTRSCHFIEVHQAQAGFSDTPRASLHQLHPSNWLFTLHFRPK